MNANDILTLVRAGFTRADLDALGVTQPMDKPLDKPVDKPLDKPLDKPVDITAIVSQAVSATVAEMHKNNMLGAAQPREQTVDDILAHIIAPDGGVK